MWQPNLLASLLVLGQVSAGIVEDAGLLVRRSQSVDGEMRRSVDMTVEPMEKRQSNSSGSTTTAAEWDAQTMAACTTALEALSGKATNDAGMAVCYNVPYLNNSTGVFQADLRLYTISTPTGQFASIPSQNVTVGLSYVGATVQAVNASVIGRRDEGKSLISWPRSSELNKRSTAPVLAQAYAFVGQINTDLINNATTTAALEKLIVPQVTLTGIDSNGLQVNASLNTDEASFVSGVFATEVTTTKSAQSPIQTLVVASNAPFVLPGQHILIFPIGGIITGVWAVLLIATIGYGTFGRMQFRDQFRRRSAMANKAGFSRI